MPIGSAKKIIVEVKLNEAHPSDIVQLEQYMDEVGDECIGGLLIAERFPTRVSRALATSRIGLVRYGFGFDWRELRTFEQIKEELTLERAG